MTQKMICDLIEELDIAVAGLERSIAAAQAEKMRLEQLISELTAQLADAE